MLRAIDETDTEWARTMWNHLQRLEKRVMAEQSEPEWWASLDLEVQEQYYQWVCRQAGELCDLI